MPRKETKKEPENKPQSRQTQCPRCKQVLKITGVKAGQKMACPGCNATVEAA